MRFQIEANGNLTLKMESEDGAVIQQFLSIWHDDHLVLARLLEETNSKFQAVTPDQVGALTDAPMLTDEIEYKNEGDGIGIVGTVWWYPQYEHKSFMSELVKNKQVTFAREPITAEVA